MSARSRSLRPVSVSVPRHRHRPAAGALLLAFVLGCSGDDKTRDTSAGDGEGGGDTVELADRYELTGDTLFPEGLAWSTSQSAFYLGSLTAGSIVRLDPDGTQTELYRPASGTWMTLGMKVDEGTDSLLVCAIENYGTDAPQSVLQVFGLADGSLRRSVPLDPGAVCNDVVSVQGRVLITEREGGRIWRVDPDDTAAQVHLEDPMLDPEIIGLNGIVAPSPDFVVVGKYAPGRLLRVDVGDAPTVREITVSGDGLGSLPDGPDGIAMVHGDLVIAANETVFTVSSDDDWQTATSRAHVPPEAVAAVTLAGDRVFGLKGEVVPYVLGAEVSLPFAVVALDLGDAVDLP